MPENDLQIPRRRIELDPDSVDVPPRAPFVELGLVSCFSFLRGASDAVDIVKRAWELGYDAIGIADANTMAGVVRIHTEAKTLKLKPVIGCRIETVEGLAFLAYPENRAAYGRVCRLISAGRMATRATLGCGGLRAVQLEPRQRGGKDQSGALPARIQPA